MPPKDSKASKKSVEKEKKKIIEDKTFGLKNKNKSKKVEQYIKSVTSQVQNKGADKRADEIARQRKEEKAKQEEAKKELQQLFKPVVSQKVPPGVDPKSVLCELFRLGQCTKGNKCKYSHDLNVERKSQKIDLYTDRRTVEKEEDMEEWDDSKLISVVSEKQGEVNKNLKTKIVCKYFLDAIEQKKYGWFWECPNGGDKCQYVHALPPGFVLKKKVEQVEDEEEPTPIEEIIEIERKKITNGTPVTLENFLKWKEQKRIKKAEAKEKAEQKRLADIKAGRSIMSGREMFVFNPDMFVDDDAALSIDDQELGENGDSDGDVENDNNGQGEYLGNDSGEEEREGEGEEASTTTTTTTEGEALAVQINESLFVNDEDIPDLPDDED